MGKVTVFGLVMYVVGLIVGTVIATDHLGIGVSALIGGLAGATAGIVGRNIEESL